MLMNKEFYTQIQRLQVLCSSKGYEFLDESNQDLGQFHLLVVSNHHQLEDLIVMVLILISEYSELFYLMDNKIVEHSQYWVQHSYLLKQYTIVGKKYRLTS